MSDGPFPRNSFICVFVYILTSTLITMIFLLTPCYPRTLVPETEPTPFEGTLSP